MTSDTGLYNRILTVDLAGNELRAWLMALALSLALLLALLLVKHVLLRRLRALALRTSTRWDDILIQTLDATRLWLLGVLAISVGAHSLRLPPLAARLLAGAAVLAGAVQLGLWASALVNHWFAARLGATDSRGLHVTAAGNVLRFALKLVAWLILLLAALDTLGADITALVAGLGVGGVAMALAVQSVIKDFVCSAVIALDKPFSIGDFVVLGELRGTVEQVGIKTTRLRGLQGEQLVVPNSDMVGNRLENLASIDRRRIALAVPLAHGAPADALRALPELVQELAARPPALRCEWARLSGIGEAGLTFEAVLVQDRADWASFVARREALLLDLLASLEQRGLAIAHPQRTVHLTQAAPRPAPNKPSAP